MNKLKTILPFSIFVLIIILLWRGMSLHPTRVPSPLIDKPAPVFHLPNLFSENKIISNKDFLGKVTLFNVWATWCYACAQEHEFLLHLARDENIIIYGLNYKDDINDAKTWLKNYGNPYQIIAVDQAGEVAIDWGVYGAPETFIIDKKGIIRYKHLGPITQDVWEKKLKPLVLQWQNEPL